MILASLKNKINGGPQYVVSANFLIKIKKERLDLQIHRSVANALIIVRFDSENFIELRYGLFFGEYD